VPANLQTIVESAFEPAFKLAMNEVRSKLLRTVQDVVEQQITEVFANYSKQVKAGEGAVLGARTKILDDSSSIAEKQKKLQDLIAENTRENQRLQEALTKVGKERTQIRKHKEDLDKEKRELKASENKLKAGEAKLNADLNEIRDERQQVLHHHQLLSKMEQGLAEREAKVKAKGLAKKNQSLALRPRDPNPVPVALREGSPAATESLQEAMRIVEEKAPMADKYENKGRRMNTPAPVNIAWQMDTERK